MRSLRRQELDWRTLKKVDAHARSSLSSTGEKLEAQAKEIERMRQGEEFVLRKLFRAGEPVYPEGFKAKMGR
jgi:hypothetical protein